MQRCASRLSQVAWRLRGARLAARRSLASCTEVRRGGGEATGGAGPPRPELVALDDAALLKACRVDTLRGSGPGGQHRNKTESGVRLTHVASGVVAQAFEERSQHANKAAALKRLRAAFALELREPPASPTEDEPLPEELRAILPGAKQKVGPNNARFVLGAAVLLDHLAAQEGRVGDVGAAIGLSTAAVSKLLAADGQVLAAANKIRQQHALKPLRAR